MTVVGFIPARGGSQRIPLKNMRRVGGRTLVELAVRSAASCDRVVVSTDHEEVAYEARRLGAEVHERPAALAGHASLIFEAFDHWCGRWASAEPYSGDAVWLQPSSPFRTARHVRSALALLSDAEPYVVSVCRAASGTALMRGGRMVRPSKHDIRTSHHVAENGAIYAFRASAEGWPRDDLDPPRAGLAYLMSARDSLDVDTLADLRRAQRAARMRG